MRRVDFLYAHVCNNPHKTIPLMGTSKGRLRLCCYVWGNKEHGINVTVTPLFNNQLRVTCHHHPQDPPRLRVAARKWVRDFLKPYLLEEGIVSHVEGCEPTFVPLNGVS